MYAVMYVFCERNALLVSPSRIGIIPSKLKYLVIPAPIIIKINAKCNNKVAHFSFLSSLYLDMLPIKFIKNKTMIASNHQAL